MTSWRQLTVCPTSPNYHAVAKYDEMFRKNGPRSLKGHYWIKLYLFNVPVVCRECMLMHPDTVLEPDKVAW